MRIESAFGLLFVLCIFTFAIFVSQSIKTRHEREVRIWLVSRREEPTKIESTFFHTGPYWNTKSKDVFKATTAAHRLYWFRFGRSMKVEEEINCKYYEIQ